ncbi:CotD family spore coat protein [Rossellomorea marisflavi]|uniref:CotD family spore coat protein n=1 Tax=Rossellomorea marisflavi TaxID=189381 RepID=UPI0025B24097|nr:CotD family spore coat protein [Rossellomorea marisflavi]WJV16934.1 CotD family spore coat protein [Rossellomorea marisflavi]
MGNYQHNRRVSPDRDEVIVNPTQRVVNTRTKTRTVKNIHPTEIINVNRTIIRNENYYPVRTREVNETGVENYDCGRDVNRPDCRRVSPGSGWVRPANDDRDRYDGGGHRCGNRNRRCGCRWF